MNRKKWLCLLGIALAGCSALIFFGARNRYLFEYQPNIPLYPLTVYDPITGWDLKPNASTKNFGSVHVGSDGNRLGVARPPGAPPKPMRVFCSGDSFTFGPDVDDHETWCAQLSQKSGFRLDAVNLAVSGYGLDQMYLKFRKGNFADPHVHILAFIDADILRMEHATYRGGSRPVARLESNALVFDPPKEMVKQRHFWIYWNGLRYYVLRLINTACFSGFPCPSQWSSLSPFDQVSPETKALTERIILDLASRAKGKSRFLLVRIPVEGQHQGMHAMREEMRRISSRLGVEYIDLGDRFDRLTPEQNRQMYLRHEGKQFWTHLSVRGHEFVSGVLLEALNFNLK